MNNNILYSLIADTENDRQEWIAFFEYEEHQKLIENFRIDIMSDQKVLTAIEKKCPAFPKNILASQVRPFFFTRSLTHYFFDLY